MQEVADAGGCASISRTGQRSARHDRRAAPPSLTRLRPRVFNSLFPLPFLKLVAHIVQVVVDSPRVLTHRTIHPRWVIVPLLRP
jgi:hypothetical protein